VRQIVVILVWVGTSLSATAHDVISTKVTWSREISRIILERCVSCHNEKGSAFSLSTYQAARPWAKAIKEETLERRMPPFAAIKGFSDLKDDQSLTQEQLKLIANWVEGGAPEGDLRLLPPPPVPHPAAPDDQETNELLLDGEIVQHPVTVTAVRPKTLREGSTVQVIAVRADGGVTPLIWIYNFNPKFERTYYFRNPVILPAGTRIVTSVADVGRVALLGPVGGSAGGNSDTLHSKSRVAR
jgi:hypothetical protein